MLYIGLGIIYVVLLFVCGVRTFQQKHWVLFVLGFPIPLLWIIGSMIPPKGMSYIDEQYAQRDEEG